MKKHRAQDGEGELDTVSFRSLEVARRLRALKKANPEYSGLITQVIVAAVTEKLNAMEKAPASIGGLMPIKFPGPGIQPDAASEKGITSAGVESLSEIKRRRASTRRKKTS